MLEKNAYLLEFVPDGDPILREECRKLTVDEIKSAEVQELIDASEHGGE